jgi:hypothetical protein
MERCCGEPSGTPGKRRARTDVIAPSGERVPRQGSSLPCTSNPNGRRTRAEDAGSAALNAFARASSVCLTPRTPRFLRDDDDSNRGAEECENRTDDADNNIVREEHDQHDDDGCSPRAYTRAVRLVCTRAGRTSDLFARRDDVDDSDDFDLVDASATDDFYPSCIPVRLGHVLTVPYA